MSVKSLRELSIDLIQQVEISDYEDIGGFLKNNLAYVDLKNYIESHNQVSSEQSFKSGINDMVKVAVRDKIAHLKNCQTHIDGEFIRFKITVELID